MCILYSNEEKKNTIEMIFEVQIKNQPIENFAHIFVPASSSYISKQ
jgi:hypothetical protein